MKRILMAVALVAAPMWGQQKTEQDAVRQQLVHDAQERTRVNKLVTLKYMNPISAQNLLRDFGVDVRMDLQMKVVALSGLKPNVETAEAALKQLDVPAAAQKDFDLTVFLVTGTDSEQPGPTEGTAIPQELQSTVTALKQTFPYKKYELLDALTIRSRAGSGAYTTGQLSSGRLTQFAVRSVSLEGDGGMIRIENLRAGVRQLQNLGQSGKSEYVDVSGVNTDVVDVKEGQKLVIGRASLGGSRALFLVLIAKVAQ